MIKYFGDWREPIGLNADIERHRAEEKKLRKKLEKAENDPDMPNREMYIRVYRNFLYLLELSKAEVVSKLGKD